MAHPLRGKPRIPRIYLFDEVDAFPIARDGCPSVPPWSDSHREHPNAAVSPSRSALPPPGGVWVLPGPICYVGNCAPRRLPSYAPQNPVDG